MKSRLFALGLLIALTCSLCSCASPGNPLRFQGETTEYSQTIDYASQAWGGVEITEADGAHTLKNQRAQLQFGQDVQGLKSLISLQTGEVLLQNTVITTLKQSDGTVSTVTGGKETTAQGNYGVSHSRTDESLRSEGNAEEALLLKEFLLTETDGQNAFSALNNDVTAEKTETGLKITSLGKHRSQFGARFLGIDLGTADHYYLSITLKTTDVSGLKCYFSTDTVPMTEDTLLGTLDVSQAAGSEYVTLTAEIKNSLWNGTLQTLLFRLPEGETGHVELSRIALLTLNDPLIENAADTLWTVYSDRIYFTQTITANGVDYTEISTVISLPAAKCNQIEETDDAVAVMTVDGSVLGFVRPLSGGNLRWERDQSTVRIILDWEKGEEVSVTLPIYLNYTDDTDELNVFAKQERTPLSEEDFRLEGAELEGYDPKGGMYRLKRTAEEVSVSVKKLNRTVYLYLEPAEGTAWTVCDKKGTPLPVFAGTTFPLTAEKKTVTVTLRPHSASESVDLPDFFQDLGLEQLSRSDTAFHGLFSRNTEVYSAPDGSYTVTLTATRLKDGTATLYDVEYRFLSAKKVLDGLQTLPLFSFELNYGFEEYFYLDAENQPVSVPAGSEQISYLGSTPYLGLSGNGESAGWLITQGQMTQGGTPATAHLCLRYAEINEGEPNKMYLSFDVSNGEFVRGDTLTAQIIRTDKSSEEELNTLRNQGNFQLIITKDQGEKTFTALGMEETVTVCLEGFSHYQFPKLTLNGEPFTPEYQVYVDKNGYCAFAFAVENGGEIQVK